MTVQEFMISMSNHAYAHGEKIAEATLVLDGDRSEYKIDDIVYDERENKFHLKVEEEG